MKTKNTLIVALLICGLSMLAGKSSELSNTGFLSANAAPVKTKTQKRNLLKLKKPAFFSNSASGIGPGDINGGGLFVNVGIFLPAGKYMNPFYALTQNKLFSMGFDAEWGHFFKLLKISKFSLGLRLTWLSASFTAKDDLKAITGSPIRVGPQFVYALKDKMAVNLFYQIGAGYTIMLADGDNYSFLGATHEIGAGFQYRIFNIGLGYRLGNIKNIHNSDGTPNDKLSYPTNNLRLFLGLKF